MNEKIYLSVILPVYNEEKLIESTLFGVAEYLKAQNYRYEIIAIDDGSTDNTKSILTGLQNKIENLRTIFDDNNFGKGFVVRRALLAARGKFRLFMDSDNSTDISEVKKFLEVMEKEADVAIGDRTLASSIILKHQATYKKILGNIGNLFVRALIIPDIKDTQCGFKCFKEEVVEDIFPMLEINRWAFDMEILSLASKCGYKIKTIPVIWKDRRESRVKILDYLFTLLDLFKIKINIITNKYERGK